MSDLDKLMIVLRMKGFGKVEPLGEALGFPAERVVALIDELKGSALAEDTRAGARLTPAGRQRIDAMLAAERSAVDPKLIADIAARFATVNDAFKQLVTRWQMREIDGKAVRNDHTDTAYDADVLAGFDAVHRDVGAVIDGLSGAAPRMRDYAVRLGAALAKIRAGNLRYLAAPDAESYHSIWFELHQDLIGLSGTTRAKEAAAGRAH